MIKKYLLGDRIDTNKQISLSLQYSKLNFILNLSNNITSYAGLNSQQQMDLATLRALANLNSTPKAGNKILALGVGMATDYLSNMLTDDMFGDSYLGSTIGLAFSNTLSSAGNTISNNLLKGNTLTQGLGLNIGSSLSGVVAGVAGDLIGKGVTSLMGDSKLGKGIGAGLANGIGSFGGTVLSNLVNGKAALDGFKGITLAGRAAIKAKNLADAAKTGMSFLLATKAALTAANAAKFASWANIGGLAGSAVGAALSAVTGPSKEYSGKYGNITLIADTAYDVAQTAVGFMGPVGAIISGGMALNKGLSNIFGSTDGMTTQDAILGSAWAGAPVKWLNMWGSSKTGTFDKQSWQNSEKTSNFMGSSFGNLADRFKKAREEAGKVYGTFSLGAKKEAQENIDFANRAWDKILAMANLDEYQNVRSRDMASINNLRYAQNILGGFTPLLIGKMGMKILNNTIDHNRGMRYLSAAALIDNKALILSAGNGIKISKLLLDKDIVYSDNTRVSRHDVMLPIQRKLKPGLQFFTRGGQTVVVLPTHAEISQDNRTKLQHLESHKKSVLVRLLKLMEKALEKTAKVAEAVLEKTLPSYWVELVTGEDLGTAGRLGVDLVSPYVIGKGIQLLGKAGRGLNKLATLGTSLYTGKWALFGNRYYRFKPGYIGMNGVPVESRTTDSKLMNTINNSQGIIIGSHSGSPVSFIESPKITPENAASITPAQWTVAQDAAIARGDMAEAQRLRDLHFKVSAPKTEVVDINGNPQLVVHKTPNTFTVFDNNRSIGKLNWFATPNAYGKNGVFATGAGKNPRTMKLYVNMRNAHKPTIDEGIEPAYINQGEDGILGIVDKDMTNYFNSSRDAGKGFMMSGGVDNPNYLKSADAVTYDNNGVRIPLGKRDDFNINDIRYGLLPFLGLGTAATLYNKTK